MRIRVLLLLLLSAYGAQAQTRRPLETSPPLTTVTLYLNRFELEHQGTLTLPAGTSRVQINNVSDYDEETLEVQLGTGAELLVVGTDEDEPTQPAVLTPANWAAADSLTRTTTELARIAAELKGLEEEKTFLQANRTLAAGTQANWSAEVQRGATLMRTRLVAIQLETNRLQAQEASLKTLATQLGTRAKADPANEPLLITVRAAQPVTVPLTLRYAFDSRWAWRPQLDIRADDEGRSVKFATNAQIRNQSGVDWQRVKLVLVNQRADLDVTEPLMEPWTLKLGAGNGNVGEGRVDQFVVKGTAAGRPVEVTQTARYEVPERFTLASGGQRSLALPVLTLAGRPEYFALPKLTDKVFLQTKITGWEGLSLPDRGSVYYRGSFVGRTQLNERAFNDSLEVSLGHDERIIVGRSKLEDFSRKAVANRRVRLTYELNVRNLHPEAVRIKVQDQIPVSSQKEVEVKILETSGAELDERTGKLTWHLRLASNTSQRLRFSFEVEFPKDAEMDIIKNRVRISSPKFR